MAHSMQNRLSELLLASPPDIKTEIVIEAGIAGQAHELLRRIGFLNRQMLVVCDSVTHAALAAKLMSELTFFYPKLLMLDGQPHADEETVQLIREHPFDALIAVGSGTISDLCKYASFLEKKPYAVFATAPSMNGYLSANASITIGGHKQTLPAQLPAGVFCDTDVLARAPKRLILSGLGDSLCRSTAQADWLLSHLLLGTPYDKRPFELLQPYEEELFAHSDKLAKGDARIVELLIRTLLISGLGMVMAGGSYPASQGEHLIAHTMEMKHGAQTKANYHGEQIGVTTLTMAKIQATALAHKLHLAKRRRREAAIASYFGSKLSQSVNEASWNKHLLYDRYEEINARLEKEGSVIREKITAITKPEAELHAVLDRAGAKTTPAELGWNEREYELAVTHARFIRGRFTFLDMI